MYGRDATHNAVSPGSNPPIRWNVGEFDRRTGVWRRETARNIKWQAELGTNTFGDPVVAGGLIWIGTNNWQRGKETEDAAVLTCLRETDGKLLYRYISPRMPGGRVHDWPLSGMNCSPLIEGDRMWFTTNRCEVVCMDIVPLRRGEAPPRELWRLDMMATRDHGARKMADTRGILKMLPSEYFDRNCGIGSSNTRRRELARRYEIGVGNIMWGNDFPHPEGTWPYTREFLKDRFWDIPMDETEKILGLNAAEFYKFDLGKLAAVAERIGPTPEELGQTDQSVLAKWDDLKAAGRPWLTEIEALPVPVG
jgi:hypothetical protein